MGVTSKIFFILIPLVFLIVVGVIFFGGEGLFGKVKTVVLGAKDLLPKVSVGLEEQKAEVSIPNVHRAEIIKLKQTIQGMLGQGKENCFADYVGFSDLGEEGTSLTFTSQGDKTLLTVYSGSGGKQTITDLSGEISGMKPCVIAGAGGVSEHFFKYFIEEEKELIYPYFNQVNFFRIFGSSSSYNGINMPEMGLQSNLEDGGWLFTPDGEHICFFPTNLVSNYDDNGIDNDYFTIGEKNSIENKIKQGELKLCG